MFASVRSGNSVRNFTCEKLFATNFGLIWANPLAFEREIHLEFKKIFKEVGLLNDTITDGDKY